MLNHKSSNLNLENISLADRKSSGGSSTHYRKKNKFNEVWPWFLFMYTWHPKQNQVLLPVSGFPPTRRCWCLFPTSLEAISCAKWRSSVVHFSPWEPGWMLELVDWYACKVGEVDVLITRQPPDKGPNQSIPSMYVFTYIFGWFFMVNVGKYVIHGCSGGYIYILYSLLFLIYIIYDVLENRFNSKILHHQKSTMGWKFLGYILSRLTWYTLWNYLPAVAIKSEELLYTSPRKKKIFQLLHNQYVPFNH